MWVCAYQSIFRCCRFVVVFDAIVLVLVDWLGACFALWIRAMIYSFGFLYGQNKDVLKLCMYILVCTPSFKMSS